MPSCEGETASKIPKIIELSSTGLMRYARLANKTKQKYGLFDKGAYKVANNPYIFLTR